MLSSALAAALLFPAALAIPAPAQDVSSLADALAAQLSVEPVYAVGRCSFNAMVLQKCDGDKAVTSISIDGIRDNSTKVGVRPSDGKITSLSEEPWHITGLGPDLLVSIKDEGVSCKRSHASSQCMYCPLC
jgi:hypothetical protein